MTVWRLLLVALLTAPSNLSALNLYLLEKVSLPMGVVLVAQLVVAGPGVPEALLESEVVTLGENPVIIPARALHSLAAAASGEPLVVVGSYTIVSPSDAAVAALPAVLLDSLAKLLSWGSRPFAVSVADRSQLHGATRVLLPPETSIESPLSFWVSPDTSSWRQVQGSLTAESLVARATSDSAAAETAAPISLRPGQPISIRFRRGAVEVVQPGRVVSRPGSDGTIEVLPDRWQRPVTARVGSQGEISVDLP